MPNSENPLPGCPSSPNCKRISLTLNSDSTAVFEAVKQALKTMNAETIASNPEAKRIDAVFKIPVFGYRDDVTIAILPDGNSSDVFIRSASREGYWDIWVNGIRVKRLVKHIKNQFS